MGVDFPNNFKCTPNDYHFEYTSDYQAPTAQQPPELNFVAFALPIIAIKFNDRQPGFSVEYYLQGSNGPLQTAHLPFKVVSIYPSAGQITTWYLVPNLLEDTYDNSLEDSFEESETEEVPAENVVKNTETQQWVVPPEPSSENSTPPVITVQNDSLEHPSSTSVVISELGKQPGTTDLETDEKVKTAIVDKLETQDQDLLENPEMLNSRDQPSDVSLPSQSAALSTQISAKSLARQKRKDRRRLEREAEKENGNEEGTVKSILTHKEQSTGSNLGSNGVPKCPARGTNNNLEKITLKSENFSIDSNEKNTEAEQQRITTPKTTGLSEQPLKRQTKRSKRTQQKNQRKSVRTQKEISDKWSYKSGRQKNKVICVQAQGHAKEILNDKPLTKVLGNFERASENTNVEVLDYVKKEVAVSVQVPVLLFSNEKQLPRIPENVEPVEKKLEKVNLRNVDSEMTEFRDLEKHMEKNFAVEEMLQEGGTKEMALLCTRYMFSVTAARFKTGVFHVRGKPRQRIENDPSNILAQISEEIEKHPLISWTSEYADVKCMTYIEKRIQFYKERRNNEEERELLIFFKTIKLCTSIIFQQDIFFLSQQNLEEERKIQLEKQYFEMMKISTNAPGQLFEDDSLMSLVDALKITNIDEKHLQYFMDYLSYQFCSRIGYEVDNSRDPSKSFGKGFLDVYKAMEKDDSWNPENTKQCLESLKTSLDGKEQTEEIEIFKNMYRILCSSTSMVIDQDVCIFSRKSSTSTQSFDHHKSLFYLWFGY